MYIPGFRSKSSVDLSDEEEKQQFIPGTTSPSHDQPRQKHRWQRLFVPISVLSMILNVTLLARDAMRSAPIDRDCVSEFARLPRDLEIPFAVEGHEFSLPDSEWAKYDPDLGTVALSDAYVAATGLPPAQRWPWDFDKGLYFLQGHHNLHCLYTVRDALLEYRGGRLQTQHWDHVNHCLTALREDIVCNADDTPRFTGGQFEHKNSGTGQTRMCRDWAKLDAWATSRPGCYRTPDDPFDGQSELERYKFCPDGSTPWVGAAIWTMDDSESKGIYDAHAHGHAAARR